MMRASVFFTMLALIVGGPVGAHSWYDGDCCSGKDCAQIELSNVKWTTEGWHVVIEPGQHPMVTRGLDVVVPFGSEDIKPSQDQHFHACISPGTPDHREEFLLCLYVPGGMA